ncbi:prohead protease/major capsid protein fusion protein [Aliiroseovarius crassostreae]|uniref:prohead protease/major capsid protein fusion protein n=1 Tax=Aliiroseovarius crassostreae TaxID=154981 RepID=UPI002208F0B1|nr:prohead protease/major capsid protein fusion protein [Aliiroseovarius crassostreae]UWP88383.1 HK97 family phage prohead protease [Aliiroseovarius crassostreae]
METQAVLTRRAVFAPDTFNADAGTVEAVISTFAPVQRKGFMERLDPAGLDTSRLIGAPVLDGHRQGSARDVIGTITGHRMEDGKLVAMIRLSGAADAVPVVERIREGTIKGVSIGYRVRKWTDSNDPVTRARVRTAAAWEINEVSAVPIPADPGSQFRGKNMENEDDLQTVENPTATETRAAIRQICRSAGMTAEQADDMIDRDLSITEARAEAFEAMQRRTPARIRTAAPANDDPAALRTRQSDALAFRMAGGELPDASREFVNMSLRDMAADALTRAGESTRGLSADELFQRAAAHGTSDFPLLVSNAMGKVALDSYRAAESPLKALARQRTLPNFKESTSIRLGEMGRLEEMTEHGEFKATSRAEAGEKMALKTFGRAINVSRKLLIDDDLNMLGDMTAAIGAAAAQTEAEELVATFIGNPDLSDGTAVFATGRGNMAAAGADITETSLDAARLAMRGVKGLDGKTIIGVTPRYLVIGPELETKAEKLLAAIYAATTDDVQPIKLKLVVEPRITGTGWYVMADPAAVPSLQFAYLSSAQGVQIQRQEAWTTLGMQYRAFLDFGTGWADWRGAYFNEGA